MGGKQWAGIDRVEAITAKIEDCQFEAEKLLIVFVHAHVGFTQTLAVMKWTGPLGIVVMPCCNFYNKLIPPATDPATPVAEYHDPGVVSPHRLVRVYLRNE